MIFKIEETSLGGFPLYVKSSKKAEKDKIEILPSRKYFD